MGNVGDIERITQNRVVKLFKDKLDYTYLGNWEDRPNVWNISLCMKWFTYWKETTTTDSLG